MLFKLVTLLLIISDLNLRYPAQTTWETEQKVCTVTARHGHPPGVTSCSARSTRRLASRSSSAAWASSLRTRATLSLLRTCQLFFGRMFIVPLATVTTIG